MKQSLCSIVSAKSKAKINEEAKRKVITLAGRKNKDQQIRNFEMGLEKVAEISVEANKQKMINDDYSSN